MRGLWKLRLARVNGTSGVGSYWASGLGRELIFAVPFYAATPISSEATSNVINKMERRISISKNYSMALGHRHSKLFFYAHLCGFRPKVCESHTIVVLHVM